MRRISCYVAGLAAALTGLAGTAHAGDGFSAALSAAKPIVDSNLRYEGVDQAGFANKAAAITWRNRLGFEMGEFAHLKLLVEFDDVRALRDDYNSTTNGKTAYPAVNDPEVTELNRAQLVWTPSAGTVVTAGRQRIQLDDQRFVGNVGWRQDEQTFDGLRLDTGAGKFKATLAYLTKINRVLAETKDWSSDSWLVNASYSFSDRLTLTAFDYALAFSNAAASSTNTWGVRAAGSAPVGKVKLGYVGQYARQTDYRNNPADFALEETMLEVSATCGAATFKINDERLGGNGTIGFVAPLGTSHAFQGYADAFSGTGSNKTAPNGINDLSYALTVNVPAKLKPAVTVIYHKLDTARLGMAIGHEWDAVATVALTPHLSLLVKYADFQQANPSAPASRTKTWLALSYKL